MNIILAMHMANELLSVPAASIFGVIALVAVMLAVARAKANIDTQRLSLMGVMGAFVFAAQMINFALPGLGTSGHLGGGVLLAILLGPSAAIVTMAGILIIQCLLFQDGGLLALGCNIINIGVVPALLGWAVYRVLRGPHLGKARHYLAVYLACLVGVTAGAALVPFETAVSGVLQVPFSDFLAVMVGVHVLIAAVEGLITFAVVAYLMRTRPQALGLQTAPNLADSGKVGSKILACTILATALLLAGVVSWFASASPDGLEWTISRYTGQEARMQDACATSDSGTATAVTRWQQKWAPLADYSRRQAPLGQVPAKDQADLPIHDSAAWPYVNGWTSLAGLFGTLITLVLIYFVARIIARKTAAGRC